MRLFWGCKLVAPLITKRDNFSRLCSLHNPPSLCFQPPDRHLHTKAANPPTAPAETRAFLNRTRDYNCTWSIPPLPDLP